MVSKVVDKVDKDSNLTKLRILAEKLCSHDFTDEYNNGIYKQTISDIKDILDYGCSEMAKERNKEVKLKSYEKMCSTIKIILDKFKIS